MKKSPKVKGIRRRWMTNSLGVVLFVILLAVTALSVSLLRPPGK